jgi:hypothetical protein
MSDEDRGYGCTNHGCVFGHPGGMGTNGACHCLDPRELHENFEAEQRARRAVRAMRARIKWLETQLATLGASLQDPVASDAEPARLKAAREALKAACPDGYLPPASHRGGCAASRRRDRRECDCGSAARAQAWRDLRDALVVGRS